MAAAPLALALGAGSAAALPARKVLILGLDGVRPDALAAAATPQMDALIASGAFSDSAQVWEVTSSGPGWSSLATGVWPDKHGVTSNDYAGHNFDEYPSFFQYAKQHDPSLETAVFAHWFPFIVPFTLGGHADTVRVFENDSKVTDLVVNHLSTQDPDVVAVHLDDTDAAGHSFGFDPVAPGYLQAIEAADAYVGEIMAALMGRASFAQEDWLVLIATDHGGSGTSHGQNSPEHRTTFYLAWGPSAGSGTIVPAPEIVDVPVTALAHLGVPIDPAWGLDGEVAGLVPEPRTTWLLATGVLLLARLRRAQAEGL